MDEKGARGTRLARRAGGGLPGGRELMGGNTRGRSSSGEERKDEERRERSNESREGLTAGPGVQAL
jgi:hypothetical protein